MNESSQRARSAAALDDEVRACLAAIVGDAVLLDSDDPATRRGAPRRIVESVERLSALLTGQSPPAPEESPEEEVVPEEPSRRIVVVDDDPVSRGLLGRMLPATLDLVEAEDGETALRLAGEEGVDFVALTWRASAFSGPETLVELKIRYPDLPVLVVAEADDDLYESVAESLGADVFLTRPLNSLQLLAAADDLLTLSREADESGHAAAWVRSPSTEGD